MERGLRKPQVQPGPLPFPADGTLAKKGVLIPEAVEREQRDCNGDEVSGSGRVKNLGCEILQSTFQQIDGSEAEGRGFKSYEGKVESFDETDACDGVDPRGGTGGGTEFSSRDEYGLVFSNNSNRNGLSVNVPSSKSGGSVQPCLVELEGAEYEEGAQSLLECPDCYLRWDGFSQCNCSYSILHLSDLSA